MSIDMHCAFREVLRWMGPLHMGLPFVLSSPTPLTLVPIRSRSSLPTCTRPYLLVLIPTLCAHPYPLVLIPTLRAHIYSLVLAPYLLALISTHSHLSLPARAHPYCSCSSLPTHACPYPLTLISYPLLPTHACPYPLVLIVVIVLTFIFVFIIIVLILILILILLVLVVAVVIIFVSISVSVILIVVVIIVVVSICSCSATLVRTHAAPVHSGVFPLSFLRACACLFMACAALMACTPRSPRACCYLHLSHT